MIDQNLLMNDLLHVSGADRVVLQEDISVKDNALVDTIPRCFLYFIVYICQTRITCDIIAKNSTIFTFFNYFVKNL